MTTYNLSDASKDRIYEHKEEVKIWCDALRSGKYAQGKHSLHQETSGSYCCLGVACKVLWGTEDEVLKQYGVPSEAGLPNWSQNMIVYRDGLQGINTLHGLNDQEGLTFNQIADLLEFGEVTV